MQERELEVIIYLPFAELSSLSSLLKVEVFSGKGTMGRSFSISVISSGLVAVVVVVKLKVVFGEAITGSVIPKSLEALNYELEKTVERGQWREGIVLPVSSS
jgi:hypothetical protein